MGSKLRLAVTHLHGHRVERALRTAADRAGEGSVQSVALLSVMADGSLEFRLAGAYERAPKAATHDLLKFLDALLERE